MPQPVVCQLLHGLRVGGAEILAARLARRLREQFAIHFVCLDELGTLGEQLRQEGFAVEVLGRRPGLDWRCPWRLARRLRQTQTAVIHAHQYTPFFYALAARLLYRRPGILFTEHGRWVPDHPRRKRIVFNRLMLRRRDRVVGVGEAVRQALILNEGLPANRVGVIYNGIAQTQYALAPGERETIRAEMGVGPADFVILQVARLDGLKDHRTALAALAELLRSVSRARLVLVGEGPEEANIRAWMQELGVEGRVRLMGLRRDIPRLLAAADVFLLSSKSEGIPLTVIEALVAGVPVVSTAAGGVGEIVKHGETGLLAPVGDSPGLAGLLRRVADDEALRVGLIGQGRRCARERFDEDQMLAAYVRLYQELLQR